MEENNIKKTTWNVLKKSKKQIFSKLIISIILRAILLITPILLSASINEVTNMNYNKGIVYIIISIALTLAYRLGEYINNESFYALYNKIFHEYNLVALKSTFQNSLFSLSRFNVGEYNNILDDDVIGMTNFFSNGVYRVVQLCEIFVVYYYFYKLNFYLFLVTVIISIILLILSVILKKQIIKVNEENKRTSDVKTDSTFEFFNGIKEIKAFNIFNIMNKKTADAFSNSNKAAARYNIKFNFINSAVLFVIEFFRYAMFIFGIFLVKDNVFEIGMLLIIYNYYQKIIDAFTTILTINVEYINLKVSMNRFNRLIEYRNPPTGEKEIDYDHIKGNIEFKNILYGYKDDPTLKDASFKIPANSITVITGKEGFGKRGVFDLLMRFNRQHKGKITIDGIDINDYKENDYFRIISMSSQNPVFFNDTIRNNLLMIEPDEDRVESILKDLKIDSNVLELKHKIDTMMNSEDDNITTTLLDMLSIARVIIKDSKIMLFDEQIGSLEKSKQKYVMEYLKKLQKNHTIVIISREKDVIRYASQIIEINGKEVTSIKKQKAK